MTLTEFLLARIAEDENSACDLIGDRAMGAGPWLEDRGTFGPYRVLADCAAKRRIVEVAWDNYVAMVHEFGNPPYDRPGMEAEGQAPSIVRLLASVYADRPGYCEEWKP